jgi:hypothetical protein
MFAWCCDASKHKCTPLEESHLKRLSHAYKTQQSGDNATPGVWDAPPPDVYLDRGFPLSCITRKMKGVLWLHAGQSQLEHGLVRLTSARRSQWTAKSGLPRGAQNLQFEVVWTVIPRKSLRTFALKFLKLFSNLATWESLSSEDKYSGKQTFHFFVADVFKVSCFLTNGVF